MEAASSTVIVSVMESAVQVLHTVRLEFCFLVFFGVFYLMNRSVVPKASGKGLGRFGGGGDGRRLEPPPRQQGGAAGRHEAEGGGRIVRSGAGGRSPDDALRNPTGQQLRDEVWFAKAVAILARSQVQRTVALFKSAIKAGVDLQRLPSVRGEELFMDLVTAAIRANQPSDALEMLKVCRKSGFSIGQSLLSSATKLCTSKQYFMECLTIYDFVSQDRSLQIDDRSLWSCLLFCSVETRGFQRCSGFWKMIQACGDASNKDFGNMIRYASKQRDWSLTLNLIKEMREAGVEVDNVVYNTALLTCVSASRFNEARLLLEEMESSDGVVDVITYNTLAKGYAKAGSLQQCFGLVGHMRSRGIDPSQVTYGILLDCCINEKQMNHALEILSDMARDGCVMNTVLYTTLIKGFSREGNVDEAMKIFRTMLEDGSQGASPDVITFSILIKANCDAGRLAEALRLLEKMMELKLAPDEVVFNNLLNGCVQRSDDKLGKRLFNNMIEGGLRPSNASFSIMIRLYSSCKLVDEALELLRTEPQRVGLEPEPRLFVQLAQVGLRERQGHIAIEAYALLLARGLPSQTVTGSLLSASSKLNMLPTGVELLRLAYEAGAHVDAKDVSELKQAAIKKHKAQIVEQLDAVITAGPRARGATARPPPLGGLRRTAVQF